MSFPPSSRHILRVKRLYKTILKLHKNLPTEIQVLGTPYVKEEFKRHKKCKPQEANIFMCEWSRYALTLANQMGINASDSPLDTTPSPLDETSLNDFREEQIVQLYELMLAATKKEEHTTVHTNK